MVNYVGTKTYAKSTGFSIGETYEEMEVFFKSVTNEELKLRGKNAFEEWNSKYKAYIDQFMNEKYLTFIYRN